MDHLDNNQSDSNEGDFIKGCLISMIIGALIWFLIGFIIWILLGR
jgi:hypothetical protein